MFQPPDLVETVCFGFQWNWRNFFATLLEDVVPLQTVDIVVVFPAYLDALGQLLLKTERRGYHYSIIKGLLTGCISK